MHLPGCHGHDEYCEDDEFCLITGVHEDRTVRFECAKKLKAGQKGCFSHNQCCNDYCHEEGKCSKYASSAVESESNDDYDYWV